jgi:hypothetical protein
VLGPFKWRRCVKKTRTIKNFIKRHPKGSYVILLRPRSWTCHVAAVVDGTFYDCNIDSIKCRVVEAWKLEGVRKNVIE